MGTYDLIKQAIQGKKQIHASYKGYARQMCPHVIGWKNGKAHALFYQFGGQSSSGHFPGWRCLDLDDLTSISVVDGPWHTGHSHSQSQTCVDEVDVEV